MQINDSFLRICVWSGILLLLSCATGRNSLEAQEVVITQPGLTRHIVGGKEAERDAWPWLAALISKDSERLIDGQFCGASLIHPRWVLTATHCLVEETPDSFDVVFKGHNLANDPVTQHRIIHVAEIFLHPAYETELDPSTYSDIALIRLAEPIYDIPTVPLAEDDQLNLPGRLATVVGWGRVMDQGEASDVLREVSVPIVSLATAEATDAYDGGLLVDMLPAGFAEGGRDSCEGDSGGPLMVPIASDPGWAQVGIVSFGAAAGCAAEDAYGIYSRVSYYFEDMMSTIHPGFTQWAKQLGIRGFLTDPDRDGKSNFFEYALGSNPLAKETSPPIEVTANQNSPSFRFQQRKNLTDAEVIPEVSTNLIDWIRVETKHLVREPDLTDTSESEQFSILPEGFPSPESEAQFIRLSVASTADLPRPRFTNGAIRYLGSFREDVAKRQREFILAGAPVGTEVGIQMISTSSEIVPRMRLLNHQTNEILQEIQAKENETEIRLTFTPQSGITYRVNLSPVDSASQGTFKFNFPPIPEPEPFDEQTISPNQIVNGELTEEDGFDEFGFQDDYSLVDYPSGATITIEVSSDPTNGGFFPQLFVFDLITEEVVAESPFQELNQTSLRFQPSETGEYVVSVANLNEGEKGVYTIQVNIEDN